jgi:hypothetical protein
MIYLLWICVSDTPHKRRRSHSFSGERVWSRTGRSWPGPRAARRGGVGAAGGSGLGAGSLARTKPSWAVRQNYTPREGNGLGPSVESGRGMDRRCPSAEKGELLLASCFVGGGRRGERGERGERGGRGGGWWVVELCRLACGVEVGRPAGTSSDLMEALSA